ncbi:hypothetical protein LN042_27620 [Kitasatospora sp. RB6PN24]|uniref:hypothetical protein n=1 Tax=Kitasatospora humi TaxID=2893891 RepID=UPI001E308B92|nr:hypothetical protein [Kitasatospora humi]MCC9310794.1 hypothetical protein [Kitasatospora humi]
MSQEPAPSIAAAVRGELLPPEAQPGCSDCQRFRTLERIVLANDDESFAVDVRILWREHLAELHGLAPSVSPAA